jgi:hypothetical protein
MTDGPSKYAGLAACAVFLVGLLIVGSAVVRIVVCGVIAFGIALAASQTVPRRALVLAIGAVICGGLAAYFAATNEITGKAIYHHGYGRGTSWSEPVTREGSPFGRSVFFWCLSGRAVSCFHAKQQPRKISPDGNFAVVLCLTAEQRRRMQTERKFPLSAKAG